MVDLRNRFKQWLINQGLAETTKNGRPGTVYEYLKRIERVSKKFCPFIVENRWELVADNIFFILVTLLVCPKNKKNQTNVCIDDIYRILRDIGLPQQVMDKANKDSFQSSDKFLVDVWNSVNDNNKNRVAILKYYEFLRSTEYALDADYTKSKSIYEEIDKSLSRYCDNRRPVIHILVEHNSSNKRARTIEPTPNARHDKDRLSAEEVATALGCSVQTVYRLGLKTYNNRPAYSVRDVQAYMNKHFHPSNNPEMVFEYNNVDYKGWVSAQEAAKKIDCSVTKVIRYRNEGRIAYINFSKRLVRYFLPDIELISAEEKQKTQSKR